MIKINIYTINLEYGMPIATIAIKNMNSELRIARVQNKKIIKVIHGYGSSGKGGKIKQEVHKELIKKKKLGEISDFLPAEKLDPFSSEGRNILSKYPYISKDDTYSRNNPGVTFVIL